jgi:HPr kinase/phosphorylase
MKPVSVKNLLLHGGDKLLLKLISGEDGISRKLRTPKIAFIKKIKDIKNIHSPSPAIFISSMDLNGNTLHQYLKRFNELSPAIIILGKDITYLSELGKWCDSKAIPLFRTTLPEEKFKTQYAECLHLCSCNIKYTTGVLVDVNGVGVLITGKSSIGKSEVALELIIKGHRLVSDDVVEVFKDESGELFGTSPDITAQHMEIRGLGIIDVSKVFGISSIRVRKKIELVIELAAKELHQIDRLGERRWCTLLGKKLPKIVLPVSPGRNIATLVEVAARLYLLERTGYKPLVGLKNALKQRLKIEGA